MQLTKFVSAALIAAALATTPALSQESATLKKIKDTGTITLGHRESSIPFSYYNDQQQVIGYSQELMMKVVDAIKSDLKLAKLDVKLMPVTSANRITLVQNGTVDIECGSTTNNTERQKQVSFSTSIFIVGTRLLTKKTSGISDFPDLAGKNVVVTAGTTSERLGPQHEIVECQIGPGVGAEIDVHMRRVGVECSVSGADVEPCR